jgi:hypothetical protein
MTKIRFRSKSRIIRVLGLTVSSIRIKAIVHICIELETILPEFRHFAQK